MAEPDFDIFGTDDNEEKEDDNVMVNPELVLRTNIPIIPTEIEVKRLMVYTVQSAEGCLHEVAIPPSVEYRPLAPPLSEPAKEYKFILDPFQKEAILCIENNESVLVSAHTSAGKTVVAEYSIALSLKNKQRVIYTTPIKALSNQKYREFQEEFEDVGLLTGDITINPSASCLIMTTEILRNMLYRGSEVMREVSWVIFDEIHYMRDKERGFVWEETLILLPDNVHYVFLSATIPNAKQFAEWVAHVHHQPCHVVYTDYRPVPLQHYLYTGGDGIHMIVDDKGGFSENNFERAMSTLDNPTGPVIEKGRGRKGGSVGKTCYRLIQLIMERNLAPAIVFSFSKKECELYATQIAKLDFNTTEEKSLVNEIFDNAMSILKEEDRNLPQVNNILPLLRRGVGIHHGGLLPLLKETVEVLFGEGLLKVLYATETFAMGLNMPARTVLFTGIQKFDGKDFRCITSGEYIQMSGRAGRRGLDDKGTVIAMIDEKVTSAVARDLLQGKADPLNSAFYLTYNMILNLLRVDDINPEYMLQKSFYQFQNQAKVPDLEKKCKELQMEYEQIVVVDEKIVEQFCNMKDELVKMEVERSRIIREPVNVLPFLNAGRLLKIYCNDNEKEEHEWGVLIKYRREQDKNANPATEDPPILLDILLNVKVEDNKPTSCPIYNDESSMEICSVPISYIKDISMVRLNLPTDFDKDGKKIIKKSLKQVIEHFKKDKSSNVPQLNPVEHMHIKGTEIQHLEKRINDLKQRISYHKLTDDEQLEEKVSTFRKKQALFDELKSVKQEIMKMFSLLHMDELKCRKRILKRLEFSSGQDVIEKKGRVACEISSADELIITELMFSGLFNNLTPEQAAALLSCFVCDEKGPVPKLDKDMMGFYKVVRDTAKRIATICVESKLDIDEDKYVDNIKPFLIDVVLTWCKGAKFFEICQMTEIFEGSIIRSMRRLEELLRQLIQAARSIGNADLELKFSHSIKALKRDIVFAASLYL